MSGLSRTSEVLDRPLPSGPPLSSGDTVPHLREDLMVARGEVPGQFEVWDPRGDGALILYDLELSVARMLDGRRRVAEVLENAARLGIPADADGLSRFIRSLQAHHFLAPRGSTAGSAGRRKPPRTVWDTRTRERFQAGMKLVRTGRRDQAVPIFQALLDADPRNAEAQEMLSLIAAGHTLAAHPLGELFASRYRPDRGAGRVGWGWGFLTLAILATGGLVGWSLLRQSPTTIPGAARSEPGRDGPRMAPMERRWHPALGELRAPATGVLAWRLPAPSRVMKGERIGEIRANPETREPGPEARSRLEELERLAATDPVYQEFLEKERKALSGQATAGRGFGLASPLGGTLTLVAGSETRVAQGELLAHLVDGEAWRLLATLRGEPPRPGADCEVAGDGAGDRASGQVLEVITRDGQHQVTCTVSAAQAPWLEQARAPHLRFP